MVNLNKLRGKIVENGLNIADLSKKIGIDKATFYRKLNGNGENFSIREVNSMVRELNMKRNEAMDIFFDENIS